jgi:hypothetical protein
MQRANGTRAARAAAAAGAERPSACSDPYGRSQACARGGEQAASAGCRAAACAPGVCRDGRRTGGDTIGVAGGEKNWRVRDLSAGRSMHSRRGPSRALLERP